MIIYKNKQKTIKEPFLIECDICGIKYETNEDIFEHQEFLKIDFIGGYNSVFGDMSHVRCDICQKCLYNIISPYMKIERG
jgi:hypothetical protein